MTDDPFTTELKAATALVRGGDRAGGRSGMQTIWARLAAEPDPVHQCVLAHHMADAQDDLAEELGWDIRALDAALRCTVADLRRHENLSIGLFMPSLHLNLADDYFRLGDFARARDHLASAHNFAAHLADDPYGRMIRGGMDRLAKKLEAAG